MNNKFVRLKKSNCRYLSPLKRIDDYSRTADIKSNAIIKSTVFVMKARIKVCASFANSKCFPLDVLLSGEGSGVVFAVTALCLCAHSQKSKPTLYVGHNKAKHCVLFSCSSSKELACLLFGLLAIVKHSGLMELKTETFSSGP